MTHCLIGSLAGLSVAVRSSESPSNESGKWSECIDCIDCMWLTIGPSPRHGCAKWCYGYADLRGYGLRVKCCILEKYKIMTDHILKLSTIVPLMVLVLTVLVGRGNKTVAAQACEVNKHRPHVDVNMVLVKSCTPGKHHSISQ